MTALTISASALAGMLADLKLTTSKNQVLPFLCSVYLYSTHPYGRTMLVGTSTNRYQLGQAQEDAGGEMPPFLLDVADADRIVSALKPYKSGETVTLECTDSTLTVTYPGGGMSFQRVGVDFPDFEKLCRREGSFEGGSVAFNPAFLESFAKIAKRRKAEVHLAPVTGVRASQVVVGENYRGLLMSVRVDAPESPWQYPGASSGATRAA